MKRISVLLLCFSLGGCVFSMGRRSLQGLDSTPYCSPAHMKEVAALDYFVAQGALQGMTYRHVQSAIGQPDSYRMMRLKNGADVEVWQYKVANRHCRGLDDRDDVPILFQNAQLIGAGERYFQQYINGRIVSVYNVKQYQQGDGISTGDIVKEVLYFPIDYLF